MDRLMHVHVVMAGRHRVRDVHLLAAVLRHRRSARILCAAQIERRRCARMERLLLVRLSERIAFRLEPLFEHFTMR